MKINEIFYSIEGEGIRAGIPCIFIRTYGCNLNCSYCDSNYACKGDEYVEMTPVEILNKISDYPTKYVTLTGGEPLLQKGAINLIEDLCRHGYKVNIETNGAVDLSSINKFREEHWRLLSDDLIITMDWKSISSGMSSAMLIDNLKYLKSQDVLKFVVGSNEDLIQMKQFLDSNRIYTKNIFVSPIFGDIEPKTIVEFILSNTPNVRMQLQIHKFIWDANMRGV